MRKQVELTKAEVEAGALDNYDPCRYDARFNENGSVTLLPCLWWDDASYARYQSDFDE